MKASDTAVPATLHLRLNNRAESDTPVSGIYAGSPSCTPLHVAPPNPLACTKQSERHSARGPGAQAPHRQVQGPLQSSHQPLQKSNSHLVRRLHRACSIPKKKLQPACHQPLYVVSCVRLSRVRLPNIYRSLHTLGSLPREAGMRLLMYKHALLPPAAHPESPHHDNTGQSPFSAGPYGAALIRALPIMMWASVIRILLTRSVYFRFHKKKMRDRSWFPQRKPPPHCSASTRKSKS